MALYIPVNRPSSTVSGQNPTVSGLDLPVYALGQGSMGGPLTPLAACLCSPAGSGLRVIAHVYPDTGEAGLQAGL